jgi:predicted nucleic acid-binding protein
MAPRTDAYVDTAAFIAFLDRSDSHHGIFARLFARPPTLVTSALVVAEGHGWFLRRYDAGRACQFLDFIDALNVLEVRAFDTGELAKAGKLIRKLSDQKLTLADAHGLVLMGEERIGSCWSTDRHMSLTGVPLVINL